MNHVASPHELQIQSLARLFSQLPPSNQPIKKVLSLQKVCRTVRSGGLLHPLGNPMWIEWGRGLCSVLCPTPVCLILSKTHVECRTPVLLSIWVLILIHRHPSANANRDSERHARSADLWISLLFSLMHQECGNSAALTGIIFVFICGSGFKVSERTRSCFPLWTESGVTKAWIVDRPVNQRNVTLMFPNGAFSFIVLNHHSNHCRSPFIHTLPNIDKTIWLSILNEPSNQHTDPIGIC